MDKSPHLPLAARLRPKSLTEVVGHHALLGNSSQDNPSQGMLRRFVAEKNLPSMIFWGSPGSGKTSLAQVIAESLDLEFCAISAVFSGMAELKKIFQQAETTKEQGRQTLLFIDEIHRFNKLQQDGLLGATEKGLIILVGATTENPSFSINSALLSRVQVFVLEPLTKSDLEILFERAREYYLENNGQVLVWEPKAIDKLLSLADGDGRRLLNLIEKVYLLIDWGLENKKEKNFEEPKTPPQTPLKTINTRTLDIEELIRLIETGTPTLLRYDRDDEHYNLISALHKSLRGSDCDAGLYWLSRMLTGGEDPHYLFRRLLRFAYEDVGLADPQAGNYVLTAWQTYERLGSPEGEVALASAVIYLGLAPKSNRVYSAINQAMEVAKQGSWAPPKHILNAPTKLMKDLDYGKGYQYDPDEKDGFSGQVYFPEQLGDECKSYYHPEERGFEREMAKRLRYFQKLRKEKN